MAAVVRAQPLRAAALIKFLDSILRAYRSFFGSARLKYEMSHTLVTVDPTLLWDRKEPELWTELIIQDRPASGQQGVATCCR